MPPSLSRGQKAAATRRRNRQLAAAAAANHKSKPVSRMVQDGAPTGNMVTIEQQQVIGARLAPEEAYPPKKTSVKQQISRPASQITTLLPGISSSSAMVRPKDTSSKVADKSASAAPSSASLTQIHYSRRASDYTALDEGQATENTTPGSASDEKDSNAIISESLTQSHALTRAALRRLRNPSTSSNANSTITSQPLTKFTCFGKLPVELRLMIWRYAANQPRIFEFDVLGFGPYWTGGKDQMEGPKPIRPTLSVNKESRYETLRLYAPLTFQSSLVLCRYTGWRETVLIRQWQVFFNPEVDIFQVEGIRDDFYWNYFNLNWWCNLKYLRKGAKNRNLKELEKVKRIAVGNWPDWAKHTEYWISDVLQHLSNLTEIIVYSPKEVKFERGKFKFLSSEEIVDIPGLSYYATQYEDTNKAVSLCMEKGMWKEGRPAIRIVGPVSSHSRAFRDEDAQAKERRLLYGNN